MHDGERKGMTLFQYDDLEVLHNLARILATPLDLREQLEQVLQARQQPPAVRVQAPAQRPKEAPLPAATVP